MLMCPNTDFIIAELVRLVPVFLFCNVVKLMSIVDMLKTDSCRFVTLVDKKRVNCHRYIAYMALIEFLHYILTCILSINISVLL